jgi:D-psicose/D-tagatose/L-ribulose 3-epimerase
VPVRFGVNTLLWTAGFDESNLPLLGRIKAWGFDGVEIARFSFDGFPAAKIRQALADEGLGCTMCSALTGSLSLVTEDGNLRAQTLDFLRQGIETAAELGASIFMGPFCTAVGYLPGRRRTQDEWTRAVESFRALGPALDACQVTLAHEPLNRFEAYFNNTAEDALALFDEAGPARLGVMVDTFHSNIEAKNTANTVRNVARRLVHFHASESDRGVPGTGQVHWRETLSALKQVDYDGWITIESFGSTIPEIAAAACIWRDLAPSVETIATDGLRFLRETWDAA